MSTRNDPGRWLRQALPLALALVLTLFAALYPRTPSTAWGVLCGGGLVLAAALLARRLKRGSGGPLTRSAQGAADERDSIILVKATACVGLVSPLACAAAMVAVVWGTAPLTVLGGIAWVQVATFLAAHWWLQKHS